MVVLMILSGFGWQKQSQLLLAPSTAVGLKKQSVRQGKLVQFSR